MKNDILKREIVNVRGQGERERSICLSARAPPYYN